MLVRHGLVFQFALKMGARSTKQYDFQVEALNRQNNLSESDQKKVFAFLYMSFIFKGPLTLLYNKYLKGLF